MNHQNPAHMSQPRYREYEYTLADGEEINVAADADFVMCLSTTGELKIGLDGNPKSVFKAGLTYEPRNLVRSIQLLNKSGSSITVEIGLGKGGVRDSRLTVPPEMMNSFATPTTGFTKGVTVPSDVMVNKEIAAANLDRRELIIVHRGTLEVNIQFDDELPMALIGVPLVPGERMVVDHAGPVYCSQQTGVDQVLWITERGFGLTYIAPGI